jgi:hypothetical protein
MMGRSPFKRLSLDVRETVPERAIRTKAKAFEEHRLRPMYAGANMGHPSRTLEAVLLNTAHAEVTPQ